MPAKSDPGDIGDVEPLADSTASQARRVVAAYATDADECRIFLSMLGIGPAKTRGLSGSRRRPGLEAPDPERFGDSDFVVVANRLPVDHGAASRRHHDAGSAAPADWSPRWSRCCVAAAGPGSAGRASPTTATRSPSQDELRLRAGRLSAEDVADYYEGFSNATLWPLYHDVIVKPIYHREWWDRYVDVNRRFAEATSPRPPPTARPSGCRTTSCSWCPKMLRELRPDLTIGFFLHIPFPPVELFMQMPWRTEIIEGLLGADLVGFHLPGGAQNFLYPGPPAGRRQHLARHGRRPVAVRRGAGRFRTVRSAPSRSPSTPPRSTSWPATATSGAARREIRAELGNPRKILLGVDRLDYTKGIDVRLKAFSELLAEGRAKRDDTVLVQLATPSRERVESYKRMRDDIERQVGHINGEYGDVGHPVVHYLHRPVPRDELDRLLSWPPTSCWSPRCATG